MLGQLPNQYENVPRKTLMNGVTYYFGNVKSKEHIIELGKNSTLKITEVIQAEGC